VAFRVRLCISSTPGKLAVAGALALAWTGLVVSSGAGLRPDRADGAQGRPAAVQSSKPSPQVVPAEPAASASAPAVPAPAATAPYPTPRPMARSFVVMGDSLSAWAFAPGASSPCATCAWPELLAAHENDFVLVHNGAVAGNTTYQMVARLRRDVAPYRAKLLIVLAGTNDVGKNYDVSETLANVRTIVRSAKSRGMAVVVLTIPPNNTDRITQLARLRATNASLIRLGKTEGFEVVDIYSALALNGRLNGAYAAADGLHLSLAGEQKVADTVYAQLMFGPVAPTARPTAPPWFRGSGAGS
jgi:lysophospholipase L1-like esterase